MNSLRGWPFVLLAAVLPSLAAAEDAPRWAGLSNPNIEIAYVPPDHASYTAIYQRLRDRRVLEELSAFLSPLKLPRTVVVKLQECGGVDRIRYVPSGPVILCYEQVATSENLVQDHAPPSGVSRDDVLVGAFVQSVLHEFALAVFDVLKVPVFGRIEDAADKLAGFIMLQFGREVALRALSGTSWFFDASQRTWSKKDFAAAAGTEQQRFFNYLCIAYGGDPQLFAPLARDTLLKTDRAKECAKEYNDVLFAFRQTILPSVNTDLLERVRQIPWLRPVDGKGI